MTESEKWNSLVSHPMQSWEWGEFRNKMQSVDRIGGRLVVWTKLPVGPFVYGYVPMSTMPNEAELKDLQRLGKKRKAIGIRFEPETALTTIPGVLKKTRGLFKPKTFVLDLTKSEKELTESLHPKARYNIRLAEKHGVQISCENSRESFDKYLDLMFSGTAKRQGIRMHGRKYHQNMWSVLNPAGIADLWVAKYQNRILAADLIFKFKKRIFYAYGATALEHREVMAPILLLWKIAMWGKENGMEKFDLWGAEDGKGFSRFKEQLGGETIILPGSFDLAVNPLLYPLFRFAEELRWRMMHRHG